MARFVVALDKAFTIDGDKDAPRLRRWLQNRLLDDKDRADHRRIRQAEIIVSEEIQRLDEKEEESSDEEDLDAKRRAIKEKMLRKTVVFPEEDEYEYETESDEDMTGIAMVKLFFVPKSEWDTVAERERLKAEEWAFKEMVKKRKEETTKIVVEEIRKDEEIQRNMDVEVSNIAADDEAEEAKEYETWKAREIDRIKRDIDAMVKEREEIYKVRKMTDEERKEWERKNPKPTPPPKKKLRFMQKDYHKGAFFQDDPDSIFT